MKIQPVKIYSSQNKPFQIKSTRNPLNLYKMMKMYSCERKEIFPWIQAISNSLDTIFKNCKMRIIKDEKGNILASYTYKIRTNRRDKKSMFIDAFVRNRKNPESKELTKELYKDMKNIAIKKNAEELTLYSCVEDYALRRKYESLGFKNDDRVFIEDAFLMRAKTDEFMK